MSLARAALGRGRELPDAVARSALLSLTRARRRRLRETTFIAVTGSAGKTTTCRLLAAALAPGGETVLTLGRWNQTRQLARAVRGAGRARFCVLELQAFAPGSLDARLRAYEPDVGVVTTVGADHLSRFGSRSAVAEEKSKLVAALPPTGVAVLNADDAEVRSMAELSRARVVLFGRSPDAEFRAEDVRAAFPDRLAFTLVTGGRSVAVQTRLCGEVWIPAVLGAVATAATLGVGLERVVEAIALVEPSPFRLAPVVAPSGITFLRDDWKASAWTVRPALETLASAAGRRRIAVLGGISDDRRRPRVLYAELAREARRHADLVVLVGPWAHHGLRARAHEDDETIVAFESVPGANHFLRGHLAAGDVVLVKSTCDHSHLERITLSHLVPVSCTRERCTKRIACDTCELLTPTGAAPSVGRP